MALSKIVSGSFLYTSKMSSLIYSIPGILEPGAGSKLTSAIYNVNVFQNFGNWISTNEWGIIGGV
jgi:hypothetical protein